MVGHHSDNGGTSRGNWWDDSGTMVGYHGEISGTSRGNWCDDSGTMVGYHGEIGGTTRGRWWENMCFFEWRGIMNKIRAPTGPGSLVSRILCVRLRGASVIYLSGLPSERCEQHHDRFTWPCNPGGLPERVIAYTICRLLPHIFTLTPTGGYFLWHYLPGYPDHRFPVPGALCCPDFPPRP